MISKENLLILLFITLCLIELVLVNYIQLTFFPSHTFMTIGVMPWAIVSNLFLFGCLSTF